MKNLYEINGAEGLVEKAKVYGLKNAIEVSGYPMRTKVIDEADETLMKRGSRLGKIQSTLGEDNYLCGVVVQFDLYASIKMWTEFERYHFADIISSQSTMHRIAKMEDDKFNSYIDKRILNVIKELKKDYEENPTGDKYLKLLYSCPTGLKLQAGITTNYRQLKTIYIQRKNHRLPEWREFCQWILTLPHFKELTGLGE